ncbi:hypothetical protein DENSPDRAFT_498993 [Dentipellis sp. KUC8613]|nr:hypothetical protein DENSPDRAFT_498993 [Dentipellis sp. KUC8613]
MADQFIRDTFGGFAVCGFLSMIFYGALCIQVYNYYSMYPRDSRPLKCLVALTWVLDSVQQGLLIHTFWYYLIVQANGVPANMIKANWSLIGRLIPTEIGTCLVECYFVTRIWRLDDKKKRYLLLMIPVVVSLCAGIGYIIHGYEFPAFADAKMSLWLVTTWASTRTFADLSIATTMVWILYRGHGQGLSNRFESLVKTIIMFCLTTGLLTSVFALLVLITYLVAPFNFTYVGMYAIYGKIFANSLLASLNSRHTLRAMVRPDANFVQMDLDMDVFESSEGTGWIEADVP